MSSDLNPIENLQGELKSATGKANPANIQELEQTAKEEKPIYDYKKHLEAVTSAKGSATKY